MDKQNITPEQIAMHIHTLRGLISYHKRMTLPHHHACEDCGAARAKGEGGFCLTIAYEDIYLQAIEYAISLAEEDYCRRSGDEVKELTPFLIEGNPTREKLEV